MNGKQAKQSRRTALRAVVKHRDKTIRNTSILVLQNLCGQRFRRRIAIAWCILRGKDAKILMGYLFR